MQATRTAGKDSSFTFELVDDAGAPIAATGASWVLYDQREGIAGSDNIAVAPGDTSVTFTVPAASLTLTGVSEGREIVVTIQTANGTVELRDYFVLAPERALSLMSNSFMTYPEALAVRTGFGGTMQGWDSATDTVSRTAALVNAYENLLRMAFRLPILDMKNRVQDYAAFGCGTDVPFDSVRRVRLREMSTADFDALPETFTRAIKRAQLAEANVLMGGDRIAQKRLSGVISETIGESSIFMSSKPYLGLPISRQAYEEVKRFVVFDFRVRRA